MSNLPYVNYTLTNSNDKKTSFTSEVDNFVEITSEVSRTYVFPNDVRVTIDEPGMLNVSKSGGHRIFDRNGTSHYIPSGWVHLYWTTHEDYPHFVL